ncbi:ATP-dependent helicase, partial [Pseudomonas aeruginosa]|nr:ATP-dependent helicase [Pseudomonas aeruginosa]
MKVWNENTGALSHLEIEPLPHQSHLVHHIIASGNYNWLIADDVGLGKTIETGMLLHALRQRDLIKRILLVTPAGLTKQWQEELY